MRESTEPVRHGIGAEIKQTGYFRLEALLLGAMLSALGGGTDAAEICGAINGKFREEILRGSSRISRLAAIYPLI